jgi:hypothetical protein
LDPWFVAGIVVAHKPPMNLDTLRHVPWTCHWGRFGVAIEDLGDGSSRVDELFWACHNPGRGAGVSITRRDECEHCPFWIEAPRFRAEC